MKINRSSKSSLRFSTESKLAQLDTVLAEYGKVVNVFITSFWDKLPEKRELLKPVVDLAASSWLSARLRKVAAREAIDMIKAARARDGDKAIKPTHRGTRMCASITVARLDKAENAKEFDCWLHLSSMGGIILDLPIRLHKHFHTLNQRGRRLESYVITRDYVQFCFRIETGPKLKPDKCIGIDTGINALASLSTGEQLGIDIKKKIEKIKRCKHGSKGQRRAARTLRQRMDEVAKEVVGKGKATLVVAENLKNITKNTKKKAKRRLAKNIRRSIGRWNVRYWLGTLRRKCEDHRVSFRSVNPYKTSQTCSSCGHIDRRNRNGEVFRCLKCDYEMNSDVNASRNILTRFLAGPYGASCKPLVFQSS